MGVAERTERAQQEATSQEGTKKGRQYKKTRVALERKDSSYPDGEDFTWHGPVQLEANPRIEAYVDKSCDGERFMSFGEATSVLRIVMMSGSTEALDHTQHPNSHGYMKPVAHRTHPLEG